MKPEAASMKLTNRRTLLQATVGLVTGWGVASPWAQTSPDLKSLQIVLPTPPGSQPDVLARWLVDPMAKRAKVPGSVVNRPGAAGAIAADAVLSADPSHGMLLLGGLDHVAYSHMNSSRRALDPFVDFLPVGAVNRDTWVLVTGADQPARSLTALAEAARKGPALSYGTSGEGTTAHLLSVRLCKSLGFEAQHVPYKESYLPDLIAGRIQFVLAPTPAVLGQIKSGRLRALATLTNERIGLLDSVPSIRELGWPDNVFYGGLFLFAPAALAAHQTRLNGWLVETLRQPDIAELYRDAAIEPTPLNLEETRQAVADRLRLVDAMRIAVLGRAR
jgi:tripartite-type tricarboxylate transporter receptor subunit TctC